MTNLWIWIVVGTAAVLAISATVAVTLGRMITHVDQRETSQQWNICCTVAHYRSSTLGPLPTPPRSIQT
jgi:hypothetical protein